MMKTNRNNQGQAYTLIELLAVVVLLSLMVGLVGVRLVGPYRHARLVNVLARAAQFDEQVRHMCQQHDIATEIVIDLTRQRVYVSKSALENRVVWPALSTRGIRVEQVITADKRKTGGKVTVPVSPSGHTPSYAVRFDSGDGTEKWLFFAGITGQAIQLERSRDVQSIFTLFNSQGPDVD